MLHHCGCSRRIRTVRDLRVLCCGMALLVLSHAGSGAAPAASPRSSTPARVDLAGDRAGGAPIPAEARDEPASFRVSDASGPAGRPIPLKIEVLAQEGDSAPQLFIFSGVPRGVVLRPGGFFGDFWAVNASVIDSLTLMAPPGFSGSFTVWVTRSRDEVRSPEAASMTVTIGGPSTMPTASAATSALRDVIPEPKPRTALASEPMLMARARANFEKGDVSGARAIYEYLAALGSSAAAMAMGETFDPLVLARLVVKGLEADPKKAQQWYEKAEALGSAEARSRLNALAAR